jgi:hypothetical protein
MSEFFGSSQPSQYRTAESVRSLINNSCAGRGLADNVKPPTRRYSFAGRCKPKFGHRAWKRPPHLADCCQIKHDVVYWTRHWIF